MLLTRAYINDQKVIVSQKKQPFIVIFEKEIPISLIIPFKIGFNIVF